MYKEKAWQQLLKNATSYIEQTLKVISLKNIQIRQTTYAGLCWRSKGELISNVLILTDVQVLGDQQELVYNSSVRIQDVVQNTYPMIETNGVCVWERERELRKSLITAWHDADAAGNLTKGIIPKVNL